ncbi:MAG: hypothetical protein ABEJ65_05005 [bacterium]
MNFNWLIESGRLNIHCLFTGLLAGFIIVLFVSGPVMGAEDCPESVHYGVRSANNQLVFKNNGLVRYIHTGEVAAIVQIRGNRAGLQVRYPHLMGNGYKSYFWPTLAEEFRNKPGKYLVHHGAQLDRRSFGCFELPETMDFKTTTFDIKEYSDPRTGQGHLKGTFARKHKDGSGIFGQINTNNVVILDTQPMSGRVIHEGFGGDTTKITPTSAFVKYTPSIDRLKMKIFGGDKTEIVTSKSFDPNKTFVAESVGASDLVFIINEFSEDRIDITWRSIPFGSDLEVDDIKSLEQAKSAGEFKGHVTSNHGYTEFPVGEPLQFNTK